MATFTAGSSDGLITSGAKGRKVITIINTDGTNAVYLRAGARNRATTSSSNYSYYLLPNGNYIARSTQEGVDLAESEYYAVAAAGSPVLSWEAAPQ